MTIDILFLAKNRLEFTRQSLAALEANTNWSLVRHVELWDDGSQDGTEWELIDFSMRLRDRGVPATYDPQARPGSPGGAINEYVACTRADVFAKLDNDVIVPPGWLDACAAVMEAHPGLDLLGIEPPASRTPHFQGGPRKPAPEDDYSTWRVGFRGGNGTAGIEICAPFYASCDSIGGIGLMRTRCFHTHPPLKPHSIYGGFTEWQLQHSKIRKGWIVPPLKVFLLDRMPHEPWAGLSKQYEAAGWQRPWSKYPAIARDALWGWWTPVGEHAVR